MKKVSLWNKYFLAVCAMLLWATQVCAETITETFESATAATSYQSTVTVGTTASSCGISWEIYYGNVTTSSAITGSNSVGLRLYTTNNYGYLKTTKAIENLQSFSFNVKAANSNSASIKMNVEYSTDGSSWSAIASNVTLSTTATKKSYNVPTGGKYIKLSISSNSTKPSKSNAQMTIDDVEFTTGSGATLQSIAISGTPSKTTYDIGDAFSTTGLVVTGTYSDASTANLTSQASFNCTPATFTAGGAQNVSVTASVNGLNSSAKQYNVTVNYTAPSTSFATASKSLTIGSTYTQAVTTNSTGAVTYSSSNPSVATVNASTGLVTAIAEGTTTITATTAQNSVYAESSATYTVTVSAPGEGTYVLVTDASELVDGCEILIVNETNNVAMSTTQNTNNRGVASVTINNHVISSPDLTVQRITLVYNSSKWVFDTGDGYLCAASSSANNMKTQATINDNSRATISINSSGDAAITFQGNYTRNIVRYNSTNNLFSCYSSGQNAVQIYKRDDGKTTPTFSLSPTSMSFTDKELETTKQITLTTNSTGAKTYTSSNEAVATVSSTGLVTAKGIGTATITVQVAATSTHYAKSGIVEVTVLSTVVEPETSFATATKALSIGETYTQTVTTNSTGAVTYTSSKPGIASVNATTGLVTALAVGTATITATTAANDDYYESTASYTVTVTAAPGEGTYMLVTDASSLAEDDEIIIVNETASKALSTTQNESNRAADVVTISNHIITNPSSGVQRLTLKGNATDGWSFYTGTGYLYTASTSKNNLKTQDNVDKYAKASIVIASTGTATITFTGITSRNIMKYNKSESLFSCYTSGQEVIQIYKRSDGKTNPTLTVSPTSITKEEANIGQTYTLTVTTNSTGAKTYTSSNEAVATVSSTGVVTLVGVGAATITVTVAATDEHNSKSVTCAVLVNQAAVSAGNVGTYTVSTYNSVLTTGSVPAGSSATYVQSYEYAHQITKGNTAILTLNGYEDVIIKGIVLNMKSNATSGSGTFKVESSSSTLAEIADATPFSSWYDNNEYSVDYKNLTVSMLDVDKVTDSGAPITITITGTTNSLYINSYTIYWEMYDGLGSSKATPITSFTTPSVDLYVGDTYTQIVKTNSDGDVTYSTSSNSIAYVEEGTGKVTAIAPGTATITATTRETDKYKASMASYTVIVTENTAGQETPTTKFKITTKRLDVGRTSKQELTTNSNGQITYSSSDESIAIVDAQTGSVTALAAGTVTITGTTEETSKYLESSASYTITVREPAISTSFIHKFLCVEVGKTITNTVPGNVTYSSNNSAIATVDASTGVVTGVSVGWTTIVAKNTDTNATDSYTITVFTSEIPVFESREQAIVVEFEGRYYAMENKPIEKTGPHFDGGLMAREVDVIEEDGELTVVSPYAGDISWLIENTGSGFVFKSAAKGGLCLNYADMSDKDAGTADIALGSLGAQSYWTWDDEIKGYTSTVKTTKRTFFMRWMDDEDEFVFKNFALSMTASEQHGIYQEVPFINYYTQVPFFCNLRYAWEKYSGSEASKDTYVCINKDPQLKSDAVNPNAIGMLTVSESDEGDMPEQFVTADNIITNNVTTHLNLTDKKDYYAPKAFTSNEITYSRANTGGWNSVCMPFDIKCSDFEDLFGTGSAVYVLTGLNKTQNQVTFTNAANIHSSSSVKGEVKRRAGGEEQSYTVTFKTTGTTSDGSTTVTETSDIIDEGVEYMTVTAADNIYKGQNGKGIKGGSGSKQGTITFSTTSSGTVKPNKIVINAANYGSDTKDLYLYINGSTTHQTLDLTSTLQDYTFNMDGQTDLASLKLEASAASSARFYVKSITVYYGGSSSGGGGGGDETVDVDASASVVDGVVKAGTPCLVKCASDNPGWNIVRHGGASNEHATVGQPANNAQGEGIGMTGAFVKSTINGTGWYKLAADGTKFGFAKDGSSITPFRLAVQVSNSTDVAAFNVLFEEGEPWEDDEDIDDEIATAIGEQIEAQEKESPTYDLSGRRIYKVTLPGIYVVNGKKVVRK